MSVRIPDMPDLGALTDDALIVGDHAGSGTFNGAAIRSYLFTNPGGSLTVDSLTANTVHASEVLVDDTLGAATIFASNSIATDGGVTASTLHVTNAQIDAGLTAATLNATSATLTGSMTASTVHSSWAQFDEDVHTNTLHADGTVNCDADLTVADNFYVYGGTGHTIGSYGPDGYLIINGKNFSAGSDGSSSLIINGGGRTPYCFEFYINGTRMIAFDGSGGAFKPGGGTWADISDARIKTDVTDYAAGLAEIIQLRPVSYKFLPETGRGTRVHYGLIAQEVETVMPEMVTQMPATVGDVEYSDMRSLDTQALIYALVSAVKELSTRVVALEGGAATRTTGEAANT